MESNTTEWGSDQSYGLDEGLLDPEEFDEYGFGTGDAFGNLATEYGDSGFLNTGLFVDEEDNSEEAENREKIISKLTEAEFVVPEDASLEMLNAINLRRKRMTDPETAIGKLMALNGTVINRAMSTMENSQATLFIGKKGEDLLDEKSQYVTPVNIPRGDQLAIAVQNILTSFFTHDSSFDSVTTEAVMERLMVTSAYKQNMWDFYLADVTSYVDSRLVAYRNRIRQITLKDVSLREKRHNIMLNSLRKECEMFNKMVDSYSAGAMQLIKQLWKKGPKLVFNCDCGEEVLLKNNIITQVLFVTEQKSKDKFTFNGAVWCPKCGKCHVLLLQDYEQLRSELNRYNNPSDVTTLVNRLGDLSAGNSYLRMTPPIQVLESALSDCIITENSDVKVSVVQESNEEETYSLEIDSNEFKRAEIMFYDKLSMLQQPEGLEVEDNFMDYSGSSADGDDKVLGKLSYHQMASYVTSMLSENYQELKYKALYSIVFFINENPLLNSWLNCDKVWHLENKLKLIQSAPDDVAKISEELMDELRMLDAVLRDDKKPYIYTREETMQSLATFSVQLKQRIDTFYSKRKLLLNYVAEHLDALSYIPVMNVNQCKLLDLYGIINDDATFKLFTELADRMIVTSHSEGMYKIMQGAGTISATRLKAVLEDAAVPKVSKLDSGFKKANFPLVGDKFSDFAKVYPVQFASLAKAAKAFRSMDMYKIAVAVAEIPEDLKVSVDVEQSAIFSNNMVILKTALEPFKDKSKKELYLDMFTEEELADWKHSLNTIPFGRFKLYRQKWEPLNYYLDRYKMLSETGKFSAVNSYDFIEVFNQVALPVMEIITRSLMATISCEKLTATLFTQAVLTTMVDSGAVDAFDTIFGYSVMARNIVDSKTVGWDKEKMIPDNLADVYRTVHGYYLTSIQSVFDEMMDKYNNVVIHSDDSLTPVSSSWGLHEFPEIARRVYSKLSENENFVDDREFSSYEVARYAGDAKTIVEFVESEVMQIDLSSI